MGKFPNKMVDVLRMDLGAESIDQKCEHVPIEVEIEKSYAREIHLSATCSKCGKALRGYVDVNHWESDDDI